MGKKVKEYKAGDFIFAKVKGYPAWPARVQKQNGKKYFVYFYGTGETANLPTTSIFDYDTNKDKFLSKSVKRRDFNDGVTQIQYDFANNVPIEDIVGVPVVMPAEGPEDTLNDTGNETLDDTAADTTAADETADEEENTTTAAADPPIEDSDDAGTLVIDEGKQGKTKKGKEIKTPAKEPAKPKDTAKTPAKEKPAAKEPKTPKAKEPKTPRGKGKKEESAEEELEEKKEEEIVSRSGRKIRPKRYIDEQTEENTTLPSPAPKKRRGASPSVEKEKETKEKESKEKAEPKEKSAEKSIKQYNAVSQSELQELKEPFKPADADKENILITYLPSGQYIGIKLFQSRPTSFKSESSRLQWDKQAASNAITLKMQLERGQITPQSISAQLVLDLNLSDEEKTALDKERETDEKKSRVQFLKTEMKLIELDAKVKTCLCLEKADTELCLKLLDELMELEIKPLMLLKHPTCLETVKRMRAYVGNTPRWSLSEVEALEFSKRAHSIRKAADHAYTELKNQFSTPEGVSFWEYFSERVLQFKKVTAKLNADELLELVHEPLEMSSPSSLTMKSAVDAANDAESATAEKEGSPQKKAKTPAKTKKVTSNTPSKPALKRQSSRNKQEEAETEQKAEEETEKVNEEDKIEESSSDKKNKKADKSKSKAKTDKPKDDDKNEKSKEKVEKTDKTKDITEKTEEANEAADKPETKDDEQEANDVETTEKEPAEVISDEKDKVDDEVKELPESTDKVEDEAKKDDKEESKEVIKNGKAEEKVGEEEEKKDVDEPRAKRSRETKKTEPPTPRSPNKRKAKN